MDNDLTIDLLTCFMLAWGVFYLRDKDEPESMFALIMLVLYVAKLFYFYQVGDILEEELFKETLEEHFFNLENIDSINDQSFKYLYEDLVTALKAYYKIEIFE